jgi:uncharacterized protein (TIGR03083 family)
MAGPGLVADSSAAGLTAQLDDVWTSLAFLGATLTDDDWQSATPCPGWPVSAQYAHVVGTESMLLGRPNPDADPGKPEHVRNDIGGFNEVWVVSLAGESRAEVLARFDEVTEARRAALAAMGEDDFSKESWTPVGKADYRRFMQIRVFDCWVHDQDVRDAVRRPGDESGPVAEQAIDEIVRALGYVVGKRAGATDGQRVTFELTGPLERIIHVAVDGRAQVVESLDGPATVTLSLGSTPFARLACGRVAPAAVQDRVKVAGDDDLGRRVLDNLAFTI